MGAELVIETAGIDSKLVPAQDHSWGHQVDGYLDTRLRDFEASVTLRSRPVRRSIRSSLTFGVRPGAKPMIKTVEAVIDEQGNVRLLEPAHQRQTRRALVIILDEQPKALMSESAVLSEAALVQDWSRSEEDAAWSHLRRLP